MSSEPDSATSERLAMLLLLVNTLACSALGPEDLQPEPEAPVQTSALRYQLTDQGIGTYDLAIPWTYTNDRSAPVFYDRCFSRLEKRVNGGWVRTFAIICPLAGPPTPVEPGTTLAATFQIHACYEANCGPRFEVQPIPGVYRLVAGLFADTVTQAGIVSSRDSLLTGERRSNRFWLDLP